jgi:hypothetical protein
VRRLKPPLKAEAKSPAKKENDIKDLRDKNDEKDAGKDLRTCLS